MTHRNSLRAHLTHTWWLLLIRGIAAATLGVLALGWPRYAMTVLLLGFGVYAVADGVVALITGLTAKPERDHKSMLVLEGVLGLMTGAIALFFPGLTALTLVYLVATWAVVTGVVEIIVAIRLREEIRDEWLLAFAGVTSIAVGLVIALSPGTGALAMVWMIGIYGLLFGMTFIMLALRVRRMRRTAVDGLDHDAQLDLGRVS